MLFTPPQTIGGSVLNHRAEFAPNTMDSNPVLLTKCDVCGKVFHYREKDKRVVNAVDMDGNKVSWAYVNCPVCTEQKQFPVL